MNWPKDRLTRFEVARIVGARTLQISLGAPILIKTEEGDPIKVAKQEFKEKILPITIKRKMPSSDEIVVDITAAIDNWMTDHKGEI